MNNRDRIIDSIFEAKTAMMQASRHMDESRLKLYIAEHIICWMFKEHVPGNKARLFGIDILPGYQKDLIVLSDTMEPENKMVIIKIGPNIPNPKQYQWQKKELS